MMANDYNIFVKVMKLFLEFCQTELELDALPKITWLAGKVIANNEQPSFGGFNPNTQTINIEILNRHPLDISRTLAHELVHFKQHLNDELDHNSGETGSKHENQANALAGIIMRKFGKRYPNLYKCKPIIK